MKRGLLALLGALISNAACAGSLSVNWHAGLLSVKADDAPRADVLREIARRTDTKIGGLQNVTDRVSVSFADADLGAALRRVAGQGSYAFVETPPQRKGEAAQYELFFASPGEPMRDAMKNQPPVVVLIEDLASGKRERVAAPRPRAHEPPPVKPDAQPVSVRVDDER